MVAQVTVLLAAQLPAEQVHYEPPGDQATMITDQGPARMEALSASVTHAAAVAVTAMRTAGPVLASPAPAALVKAAAVRPALPGSFSSWRKAQQAAGFRLRRPARTYGLVRRHPILVGTCMAAG